MFSGYVKRPRNVALLHLQSLTPSQVHHPPIPSLSLSLSPISHRQHLFACSRRCCCRSFIQGSTTPSASSMGFPSVCYTVLLPRPLALVVHLLDRLKLALFYLGLSSSFTYDDDDDDEDCFFVYSLPVLPASSSSSASAAAIKTRLPVVKLSALRTGPAAACAVCLGALEPAHEVRALGSCSHAFHKDCIDKWVDIGQLTCPLCRALLLPMEIKMEEQEQEQDAVPLT